MAGKSSLLEQVRRCLRLKHYSIRTERAYVDWIKRFILFHGKRHPSGMGSDEIRQFLSHLATDANVAAATQNQALCALLFLYRDVLGVELPCVEGIERAKRPARVPVVLTRAEADLMVSRVGGTYRLMAGLLYGSGLRLMERVRLLHEEDLRAGSGRVYLPYALERKYQNAAADWVWQWVFPAPAAALGTAVGSPVFCGFAGGDIESCGGLTAQLRFRHSPHHFPLDSRPDLYYLFSAQTNSR